MNTMNNGLSGKRLFIIGAGIFQTPAIKKAKEMGLRVITADKNPQSEGFQYADHYEIVSTHDSEALLNIAQKYRVEGVMTLSTEIAVVPTAYVAERLHLPGLTVDVARKATNKYLMRKAFKENDVPCPEFYLIKNSKDLKDVGNFLRFPLMVKPTTGYASKGIQKVQNKKALERAFHSARNESSDGSVLVEEFIQGREVGGESFTVNGETCMIYITNKKLTKPPQYIPLGHTLPCMLKEEIIENIKGIVKKGIKALGVRNGPVNFDIMVTRKGPKVLEMGARLGGNCLPIIVSIHSGIDTIRESIKLALGKKPDIHEKQNRPVGVRLLTSKSAGTIKHIAGIEELKKKRDVIDVHFTYNIGDTIHKLSSGVDKIGYLIIYGENVNEVERTLDTYSRKIKVTLE
jgi:biotin carboxylase